MGHAMGGWDVLARASELAGQGQSFALATVVWRQGPSSGQLGGRAIITAAGEVEGWIGGACAEPVVIREARQVIATGQAKLLLLGTREQFRVVPKARGKAGVVPEGMTIVPISCQSEGALEVFIEPVEMAPHLVVVGRSPMAATLAALADALGWRTTLVADPDLNLAANADTRSLIVVATQGHGDEDAIEQAVAIRPAYLGLVASRRRGEAVLGYLADRGLPADELARVKAPAGLDLGRTSHREIAVAILAELVQLRAAGALYAGGVLHTGEVADAAGAAGSSAEPKAADTSPEAIDPVCGMTVAAGPASYPLTHEGVTYYFCCSGCRQQFEQDPAAFVTKESRC